MGDDGLTPYERSMREIARRSRVMAESQRHFARRPQEEPDPEEEALPEETDDDEDPSPPDGAA
jgi:hypothetical protein